MTLAAFQMRLLGAKDGSTNRILWRPEHVAEIAKHFGVPAADLAHFAGMGGGGFAEIIERDASPRRIAATLDEANSDAKAREYSFTISTPTVDRMSDTIAVSGWDLRAYRRNPVVLWQHNQQALPVGRAVATWIDGQRLKSTVRLSSGASNPQAERVKRLLDDGALSATSVGFAPKKLKFSDDPARRFGIDFLEQDLLEWSIVNIPANPEALLAGKAVDIEAAARLRRTREIEIMRLRA